MSDWNAEPEIVANEEVVVTEVVIDGEVVEVITDDITTVEVVVDGEVVEIVTDEIVTDEIISDGELVDVLSEEVITDAIVVDGEVVEVLVDDEAVEVEFAVERPATTGDPRVDDAMALLDDLDSSPTSEHVAIVEDVHRRLQDALGDPAPDSRGGS